jgi:hypothetical protein
VTAPAQPGVSSALAASSTLDTVTIDPSTYRKLNKAMETYRRHQREIDKARETAYAGIRKAHATGMSLREIAEATEMSHQRVAQIVRGDR